AAKRAVDAGIVVVAAAGNMGKAANGQPQYGAIAAPGNAPWVLTVGASSTMGTVNRSDDTIADYSSRGPTMYDYAAKSDLVAPGGTAWAQNVVWGDVHTPAGQNIVWGDFCGNDCQHIVKGNNLVWGNYDDGDNIVWGNYDDDNIVWGNADDDNIVWGNGDFDN